MGLLPQIKTPNLAVQALIPAPSESGERVFTDGTFKGYRFHVAVPTKDQPHGVNSIEKSSERKLQIIKRPLRDGADINDFGRDARTFSAEVEFHGPNYLNEFASFEAICNEGTAGKLILPDQPKAVLAMFQKMSVRSSAQNGESLLVGVSWIEAGSTPSKLLAEALAAQTADQVAAANDATSRLEAAVSNAQDVIKNNVFMKGVQSAYGKLSQARSTINAALKASNTQRKAILDSVGSIQSTLGLANSIGDRVLSFVSKKSAGRAAAAPTAAGSSLASQSIDAQTGQQVADFAEPDTVALAADPLAKPSVVPEVQKEIPAIQTGAGAELAVTKVAEALATDAETLAQLSGGRTDDISRAITKVRLCLVDLAATVKPAKLNPYLLQVELSLAEVLFFNGISVDRVQEIYEKNTHIEDVLAIPAGTVIYL